jgi:16S rRNA (uracil1498-N3)-methyltransferase
MTKTTPRVFIQTSLSVGAEFPLSLEQGHYVANVLRCNPGDALVLFNGSDGEFLAYITSTAKKSVVVRIEKKSSDVKPPPDIDYLFAPLKHARLDYMVQKATELGARRLRPVITARTIAERVNLDRMRANAIEAAEQCNLVFVPEVLEPEKFSTVIGDWQQGRSLVFCDERAKTANPVEALKGLSTPAAVLVGPEGGFTPEERELLLRQSFVTAISLGPRIMRADTVAISALAVLQAAIGDWR